MEHIYYTKKTYTKKDGSISVYYIKHININKGRHTKFDSLREDEAVKEILNNDELRLVEKVNLIKNHIMFNDELNKLTPIQIENFISREKRKTKTSLRKI